VKCSATQCGFRVCRLYAERCAGVVNVSVTGPGKPYCRMPVGLTGAPRIEEGIEGIGAGAGRAGAVRDGEGNGGVLGTELSDFERNDENTKAVRAAPAPAEVAAMMARVVLDIFDRYAHEISKTQRVEDQCSAQ
jgi:hypothetical protein